MKHSKNINNYQDEEDSLVNKFPSVDHQGGTVS